MNRITIAASALALSAMSALAQTPTPAPAAGAGAARPATAAGAPSSATTAALPGGTTSGARGSGIATTAADARTTYQARVEGRRIACQSKGATYLWKPPHNVSDARPDGGFYTTNSGGSCREMSLKVAREKGLVTVRN